MQRISTVLKEIPNVSNMMSSSGNDISNQFIIRTSKGHFFQSYSSIIVAKLNDGRTLLDRSKWDYSVTTGKYRNQFLGRTKKETQALIDSDSYILADLNG